MASDLKSEVRDFWNRNVNQFNQLERADVGTKEFYQAALDLRYEYHYHLLPLFDRLAQQYPQGHLLEVGCSMGNDSFELAKRGFQVTGIDITEKAIDLIRQRFTLYQMPGDFRVADAENLPFDDNSFDVVYSFGVLHHTPNTEGAIEEIRRVLKPHGKASIMLYNQLSLNWLAHALTGIPFDGSKSDPCPVEKAYLPFQVKSFFKHYATYHLSIDYLFGYGWGGVNRWMPSVVHRALGRVVGWHLMIEATK